MHREIDRKSKREFFAFCFVFAVGYAIGCMVIAHSKSSELLESSINRITDLISQSDLLNCFLICLRLASVELMAFFFCSFFPYSQPITIAIYWVNSMAAGVVVQYALKTHLAHGIWLLLLNGAVVILLVFLQIVLACYSIRNANRLLGLILLNKDADFHISGYIKLFVCCFFVVALLVFLFSFNCTVVYRTVV